MNNAQIQKTLKNLTERKEILDDWSAGFVESVQHQFETGRRLSGRQIEIIQRISSENTEEMLRLQQNFKDLWLTDGYKEKWDIFEKYTQKEFDEGCDNIGFLVIEVTTIKEFVSKLVSNVILSVIQKIIK